MSKPTFVCPPWLCFTFDNPLRKLLHNPRTLFGPYVQPGHRVIDVGPGMGFFTIPLAERVGPTGHVTAIDVQPAMLDAVTRRAQRAHVADRITTHCAPPDTLAYQDAVDFILAFWMVHEVPNQRQFLSELLALLKPTGHFLLAEPLFHVSKAHFQRTVATAQEVGFTLQDSPAIRLSRSVLLTRA